MLAKLILGERLGSPQGPGSSGTEGKAELQDQGHRDALLPSTRLLPVASSPRPGCLLDHTYQQMLLDWYQLVLSKALEAREAKPLGPGSRSA